MDATTKPDTIGLVELLDEVSSDLEEFRKKNPGDYQIKTVSMWWLLERERVLARHAPATAVKKLRRVRGLKRWLLVFTAGWLAMIGVQASLHLLTA